MATILIVDDLVSNRRALAALLEAEGHKLVEAADGRAGLAAVLAEAPDLVITDVLMPIVDGYEFVRQLRLDPRTSAIPVLFYTAPYGEREARALATANGVPYVLTKPPLPKEVLHVVGRVLAGALEPEATEDSVAWESAVDREQLQLLGDQLLATTEDLRLANTRLRALINIGLDFASQRDSDRRLRRVCSAAHDLFGATYVTIGLLDQEQRIRRVVASGVDSASWAKEGGAVSGVFKTVVDGRCAVRSAVTVGDPDRPFPSTHPEVQEFVAAPIASPTRVYGWICLVRTDGAAFTVDQEHEIMALAGHVGRIYELEHEISERHLAEAALQRSDRLNHNLLAHLPHRIIVKDRNSVVRFCNVNYATDLGLRVDEVVGKDAFAFYPKELAAAFNADDLEVMSSGVLKTVEEPYEIAGRQRWAHTTKVPYRDEDGAVTGVLIVYEDVTERRALEEQYQQAQKMEAVGQLASGVAHDFNNLLTAILGYCALIIEDLEPGDRHRDDVQEIHTAGMRAAGLTKQLLAFSRKEIIEPTTIDVNDVVSGMRVMLGRLIREDVKIMIELDPDLAMVRADRGQVEQIVLNLAINARDAMPTGGTLTIETDNVDLDERSGLTHPSVRPGPHVALSVSDTGLGMTPDVQARIFEPFFTTKVPGRGTGLGLPSVHGIVARCGGSVAVYSEIGSGSVFKVYLPAADGLDAPVEAYPSIAPLLKGTETILVVEDAEELRNLSTRFLTRQGYTVLVAANAEEATRQFGAHTPIDLLLTDVVMPGISGPELGRRLIESRPALKVIYMSGYTEDTIVKHGVLLPGIAFLPKPFTADTLGRKIRAVLDGAA